MTKEKQEFEILTIRCSAEESKAYRLAAVELAGILGKPVSLSAALRFMLNSQCGYKKETAV